MARTTRTFRFLFLLLFLPALCCLGGRPAAASAAGTGCLPHVVGGPWYVAPGGSDANDCAAPARACATIAVVLARADFRPGDTVFVASGVYTATGAAAQVLLLDRDVLLSGGWDDAFLVQAGFSVLDGQDTRRGLSVMPLTSASLSRFQILNGATTAGLAAGCDGGGILNLGALTLIRCAVAGCHAHPTCNGGGIRNAGRLRLVDSSVTGSSTGEGSGGGIRNDGTLVAINTTISGNSTAGGLGGGLANAGAAALHSVTVSDNSPGMGVGGGIWTAEAATLAVQNSLVAGNWGLLEPDCSGRVQSGGYNLIGNAEGCEVLGGAGDLLNRLPGLFERFGMPAYHPLLPGSPAIDAGDPAGCRDDAGGLLAADQRGVARTGRCDIGAYEFDPLHDPLRHAWLPLALSPYPVLPCGAGAMLSCTTAQSGLKIGD